MENFIIGMLVGLFSGVAISGLFLLAYVQWQSHNRATDISVEEVEGWIDEHDSEMDNTIPLIVLEEPQPSAVGDAEVRRRSEVVKEIDDEFVP